MKTIGIAIVAVFALVGAFASAVFALAQYENPSSSFATYKGLADSGLIERGWVSEYLPRSATEIEESHDIDTNEGWASFKYAPGDMALAREHCRLLHQSAHGEKFVCPPFEKQTSILVLRSDGNGELTTHADEV